MCLKREVAIHMVRLECSTLLVLVELIYMILTIEFFVTYFPSDEISNYSLLILIDEITNPHVNIWDKCINM